MRRLVLAVAITFGLGLGLGLPGGAAVVHAEPPHSHEILYSRPSGFWTSNRPAVGGAYRYRLLGIGTAIALGMGLLMWRLVKRANEERDGRGGPGPMD